MTISSFVQYKLASIFTWVQYCIKWVMIIIKSKYLTYLYSMIIHLNIETSYKTDDVRPQNKMIDNILEKLKKQIKLILMNTNDDNIRV